jgi:hypothetical protein
VVPLRSSSFDRVGRREERECRLAIKESLAPTAKESTPTRRLFAMAITAKIDSLFDDETFTMLLYTVLA